MTSTITAPRIIAAVDGSPSSLHAALWAAAEAAERRQPIRLVHAVDTNSLAYGAWLAPGRAYFDLLRSDGEHILADSRAEVLGRYPDLDVTVAVRMSGPAAALVEESDGALLLVVGARGTGGSTEIRVGSSVVAVAEHAHCPVAVIRGNHADETPPIDGPVVVGVDGSPLSDAAVAAAFDEASWRRADLVAVHAWTEPFSYSRAMHTGWDEATADDKEVLAERLAGWQEKYPDVTVRRVVDRNTPARSLLENAVPAQLLVVGSRGHGGFTGLLLGSTSQALIQVSGAREPGFRMMIPFVDVMHRVTLRIITMPIQSQGIITRDNVSVDVSAVAYFRIVDGAPLPDRRLEPSVAHPCRQPRARMVAWRTHTSAG